MSILKDAGASARCVDNNCGHGGSGRDNCIKFVVNDMDTLMEEQQYSPNHHSSDQQLARMQQEVQILLPPNPSGLLPFPSGRRMTGDSGSIIISRRPSAVVTAMARRQSTGLGTQRRLFMEFLQGKIGGSKTSLHQDDHHDKPYDAEYESRMKNRRAGDDALTTVLSAFYAKLLVVMGVAFPITDILSYKTPPSFYQGFYLYLYVVSVLFMVFMFAAHMRTRALFSMIDSYQDKKNPVIKKSVARYGSFYLRVGAIAFGIGSMVYSGLEFGQYFELKGDPGCQNVLIALTPAARMILSIVQMQFIFLHSKEYEMDRHKVISRFGLMHMVATNLCEWLYVLVEETKHEIDHLAHIPGVSLPVLDSLNDTLIDPHHMVKRATASEIVVGCRRTNIMGSLVQNAAPFLFPCTIEYSLICAVICFEMWKHIKGVDKHKSGHHKVSTTDKPTHQLSVDCARAHRGMFAGILVIVLAIISLIMFFVLSEVPAYYTMATLEVTISELILYIVMTIAICGAFLKMRDLKFSKSGGSIPLDCTLLLLAQVGVYIYSMFSIIGCYFTVQKPGDEYQYGTEGLVAEVFCLLQTSLQTIFVLNSWYRRCKGAQQNRRKPGREMITFLLVANMAMWFINTLVKNRASFRTTHLHFYGVWGWTIITHVSMPLAIFYRFHSTICLFEIWKTSYKAKHEDKEHRRPSHGH